MWFEILVEGETAGIICIVNMHKIVDVDAHIVFFDRDLADKVGLGKAFAQWLFANFPIERVTVDIPVIYYATVRLVRKIGFKDEGRKRNAVLIGGRWVDSYIFGLLREEVTANEFLDR